MRVIHWLFVVSAALFISGIGFIIAGARTAQAAAPAAVEAPAVAGGVAARAVRSPAMMKPMPLMNSAAPTAKSQ